MKKLFIIICALVVGIANADNVITSKEYVDTQGAALQQQVPAKNTNTVLTYPAAGTENPGEKAIYDTSAAYGEQTDALVTAGQFNNALQVALDTEFVCTEWQGDVHDNAHCLLYEVRTATLTGYTQLEYLESTGTQYINTGIAPTNNVGMSIKYAWTRLGNSRYIFGSYSPHYYLGITSKGVMAGAYGPSAGNTVLSTSVSVGTIYQYDINLYNSGTVQFVGLTPVTTLTPKTFNDTNKRFISLFSVDDGGNKGFSESRIYHMQITDGSALVRNFIPARRDSDGELGLYDTVTNTFFTNAGSGEFIAGPVFSYLPQGN